MLTIDWTPDYEEDCDFYDANDKERLTHTSVYEAITEGYLDGRGVKDLTLLLDETIEVLGYNHSTVSPSDCLFLNDILERLNEEFGDPDGDLESQLSTLGIVHLRELESAFCKALSEQYRPWSCHRVVTLRVPFRDWWNSLPEEDRQSLLV